jgi:hypothetical protein
MTPTKLYSIGKPVMEKWPEAMPLGLHYFRDTHKGQVRDGWATDAEFISADIAELFIIGAWVKWLAENTAPSARRFEINAPCDGVKDWSIYRGARRIGDGPTFVAALAAAMLAVERDEA